MKNILKNKLNHIIKQILSIYYTSNYDRYFDLVYVTNYYKLLSKFKMYSMDVL